MGYSHTLVAAATTPGSQRLSGKAVSIARPVNVRISLITPVSDPELYNRFAAPVLEDLCKVMWEKTQDFIDKLSKGIEYPTEHALITYGALSGHILDMCRKHAADLIIYGNHNHGFLLCASCSTRSMIHTSQVDVPPVPLAGDQPTVPRLHTGLEQEEILSGN